MLDTTFIKKKKWMCRQKCTMHLYCYMEPWLSSSLILVLSSTKYLKSSMLPALPQETPTGIATLHYALQIPGQYSETRITHSVSPSYIKSPGQTTAQPRPAIYLTGPVYIWKKGNFFLAYKYISDCFTSVKRNHC